MRRGHIEEGQVASLIERRAESEPPEQSDRADTFLFFLAEKQRGTLPVPRRILCSRYQKRIRRALAKPADKQGLRVASRAELLAKRFPELRVFPVRADDLFQDAHALSPPGRLALQNCMAPSTSPARILRIPVSTSEKSENSSSFSFAVNSESTHAARS